MNYTVKVEGDIAFYNAKKHSKPFLFDSKYLSGFDKLIFKPLRDSKGMRGLKEGQEYTARWLINPILVKKDAVLPVLGSQFTSRDKHVSLIREMLKDRGIDPELCRRIVTKFKDDDMQNMRSDNLVLAEAAYASSIYTHPMRYQLNSRIMGESVYVPKEDIVDFFHEHYKDIDHPMVLSVDGMIKATRGC
jgi:hypothetical protein